MAQSGFTTKKSDSSPWAAGITPWLGKYSALSEYCHGFHIPITTGNRGGDRQAVDKPMLGHEGHHVAQRCFDGGLVGNDAAFTHIAPTDFELRFEQDHPI